MKRTPINLIQKAIKTQWFLVQPGDPDWTGEQWVYSRRPKGGDCLYDSIEMDKGRAIGKEQPKVMLIGLLTECGYSSADISDVIYCGVTKVEAGKNIERYRKAYNAIQKQAVELMMEYAGIFSELKPYSYKRWIMTYLRVIEFINQNTNTIKIEKPW